jgi:predicted transcriptional regulator
MKAALADRSESLTRRERAIMDVLHRVAPATARRVLDELPTRVAYSTVRTQLRVLEFHGLLRCSRDVATDAAPSINKQCGVSRTWVGVVVSAGATGPAP